MIPDAWLGSYGGGDSWEDEGGFTLTLRKSPSTGLIEFSWLLRYENNHGYSQESEEGVVLFVDDDTWSVRVAKKSSSAWEDMYKEHSGGESASEERTEFKLEGSHRDRPVLIFRGRAHRFLG
jgi:hypothetical protein